MGRYLLATLHQVTAELVSWPYNPSCEAGSVRWEPVGYRCRTVDLYGWTMTTKKKKVAVEDSGGSFEGEGKGKVKRNGCGDDERGGGWRKRCLLRPKLPATESPAFARGKERGKARKGERGRQLRRE
ncbi:hypothetical protein U1Q18_027607 [Sarracenia purpurea var. burkii]